MVIMERLSNVVAAFENMGAVDATRFENMSAKPAVPDGRRSVPRAVRALTDRPLDFERVFELRLILGFGFEFLFGLRALRFHAATPTSHKEDGSKEEEGHAQRGRDQRH